MTNFDSVGLKVHNYEGEANINHIAQWLVEPMIPPLVEYDTSIGETMRTTTKPTIILFRPEEDEFEDYAAVYKQAALKNSGKAIFVWADKEDGDARELAAHMKVIEYGLQDKGGPVFPSLRALWIYRKTRYIS